MMYMTTQEISQLFIAKPYFKRMGKGKIAKILKCTVEDVIQAKYLAYKLKGNPQVTKLPKILLLDIETSPLLAYVFDLWKQNISIDKIVSDWYCICWSAKWVFSTEIMSDCVTPEEALAEDDKRIMQSLAALLNEADVVITHNGDKFDLPRINTRLLLNGINPPTPSTSIDTCKIARNQFGFTSNKLDFLATKLGIPNKIHTTFELWKQCVRGNKKALNDMVEYNRYDVELLESVYLKLRPWIKNHPNMALYLEADKLMCPNCGSTELTANGYYYTGTGKYELYTCECGAHSRLRNSALSSEVKPNILNKVK